MRYRRQCEKVILGIRITWEKNKEKNLKIIQVAGKLPVLAKDQNPQIQDHYDMEM